MGLKDLGEVELDLASGRLDGSSALPPSVSETSGGGDALELDRDGGRRVLESASVHSVGRGDSASRGFPPAIRSDSSLVPAMGGGSLLSPAVCSTFSLGFVL